MKITLSIAAMALVSLPAVAHANPSPEPVSPLLKNCISNREWTDMTRDTMSGLEKTVDATGRVISTKQHGRRVIKQYRLCGHTAKEGYVQIYYGRNQADMYMSNFTSLFNFTSPPGPLEHQPA